MGGPERFCRGRPIDGLLPFFVNCAPEWLLPQGMPGVCPGYSNTMSPVPAAGRELRL